MSGSAATEWRKIAPRSAVFTSSPDAEIVEEITKHLRSSEKVRAEDCFAFGLLPNPEPHVALSLIRDLFRLIDGSSSLLFDRYLFADDYEIWSVLGTLASNQTCSPVILTALYYEDAGVGVTPYLLANPAFPNELVDAFVKTSKLCLLTPYEPESECLAGLLRRPNLTSRHLRALIKAFTDGGIASEELTPAAWHSNSGTNPEGTPVLGAGAAIRVMLSPDWAHHGRLTESDKSRLMVLTASNG